MEAMVRALGGLAILGIGVVPRIRLVLLLRRHGRPWRVSMRPLYTSLMGWFGLCVLISLVSPLVAGILMLMVASAAMVVLVTGLVRGVWRFPTAVRLIGDPEAWRGNRHPYWESRDRETQYLDA
jgi:O-antigen ligase